MLLKKSKFQFLDKFEKKNEGQPMKTVAQSLNHSISTTLNCIS